MFNTLRKINQRPAIFSESTTADLWTSLHISKKMLEYHLDPSVDLASRNHAFIDKSVEWIARRFDVDAETDVCDFGCGPGLYTSRFAKLGAKVTGIDFSENSVQYARETAAAENLNVEYIHADYLDYSSDKKYDLITMIFCDFCALSSESRASLLKIFRRQLKPGGSLLIDVLSHSHFDSVIEEAKVEHADKGGFWSDQPYVRFENTYKYNSEKVYLSKHSIVEESSTRDYYNWLQCYNPETLQKEFMANGLRIKEFYSDAAGANYNCETPQFAVSAEIL